MTPAAVTAGPMMRNDGVLARSANTQAVPLAAGLVVADLLFSR
jgi:hypothetical protein